MVKSLKEQNNWRLWLIVAANVLLFYTVLSTGEIKLDGLFGLLRQAPTLIPVGIAGIIATVLNALPSADLKATLIYWRRKHALPGHRAFSVYVHKDTRIVLPRLLKMFKGALPTDPVEQNGAWYRLYKTVRDDVVVSSAHKVFLLLRDYTALSCFFLIVFGPWALSAMSDKWVAVAYVGLLLVQYLIVRQGAANAGIRMVTNVLALKAAAAR